MAQVLQLQGLVDRQVKAAACYSHVTSYKGTCK